MLADTIILTPYNTSNDQKVVLPNSTEKYSITLFASDLSEPFEWLQVIDFDADSIGMQRLPYSEAFFTMLASESLLRRDWDQPEEDVAWMDL